MFDVIFETFEWLISCYHREKQTNTKRNRHLTFLFFQNGKKRKKEKPFTGNLPRKINFLAIFSSSPYDAWKRILRYPPVSTVHLFIYFK